MILRVSGRGDRVDHLSRCRYVRACSVRGPLYPLNALMLHGLIYAQHAKNLSTDRPTISRTRCAIFRHRNAVAGDVHYSLAAEQRELGCACRGGEVVEAQRRYLARYALGRRKSGETGSLRLGFVVGGEGNPRPAEPERQATAALIGRRQAFEIPRDAPAHFAAKSPWQKTAPCQLFDSVQASRMCFRWRRSKC